MTIKYDLEDARKAAEGNGLEITSVHITCKEHAGYEMNIFLQKPEKPEEKEEPFKAYSTEDNDIPF